MKIASLLTLLGCMGVCACGDNAASATQSTATSVVTSSVERSDEEPNGVRTPSDGSIGTRVGDPFASIGNAFTSTNSNSPDNSSSEVPADAAKDMKVFRALPKRDRVGPPMVGSWSEAAFLESSGGEVEAIRTNYSKSSTKLMNTIEDEAGVGQPDERTVSFNEAVEFVVIYAGAKRDALRTEVIDQLESEGWTPGGSTVISGDGNDSVHSWQSENQVVYLAQAGGLLLYARETNGEHVTGSGLGTSYGAQLIVIFQASYEQ